MDSLYGKLIAYSDGDVYPFHMPGHKRRMEYKESPFSYDITEIDGFDNLHHARGVLKESMDMAADFYGTVKTYYLVNGSTCGLLSAISSCGEMGDTILMARNCHKAVYNAMYLRQIKARYIYPKQIENTNILGGIDPIDVLTRLKEYPETKAVVITSPTYEGVVSHVEAIAKIVHNHGALLIVDEAHGAHFSMSGDFPRSAIECGADIVIQSVHKTLPSLTQTALLHVCSDRVNLQKLERFLGIYQTSSPSYVLMASIDSCLRSIMDNGPMGFVSYEDNLRDFRDKAKKFTHIKLLDKSIINKASVCDLDEGKLVFIVKSQKLTGYDIHTELLLKYHLQMEMTSTNYFIAMTSLNDTKEGFDRLYNALEEIDRNIRITEGYKADSRTTKKDEDATSGGYAREAVVCMEVYEAIEKEKEVVDFTKSSGRISCEYIYLYPPGVPIIVPGEMIDGKTIDFILQCKKIGLNVIGQEDDEIQKIMVIKESWKEFNYGKNILPNGQKFIGEGYHL